MRIRNSTVLVTGASSGIGKAIARSMANEGGRMILVARNVAALEHVAEEITAERGSAYVYPADVTDAKAVDSIAHRIREEVGVPDIIVNNAGAGQWKPTDVTTPEEVVRMMAAPYFGAFYMTRAFLPEMLARRSGHIVNMTSGSAYFPMPGATAYTAARWAMRGFNEALRADLYGTGIGVTLIAPGKVDTPYFDNNPGTEEQIPKIATFRLIYRVLSAEDVAKAVVRAVRKNKKEVILPAGLKLTVWFSRFWMTPVEWLLITTGPRRHRLE